ncbi:MAG: extracellular solute-binding protein [Phycisphaerales bacterium]
MRHTLTLSCAAALLSLPLVSCENASDQDTDSATSAQTVTLYTSVDDSFARMVVDAFEDETGIRVDVLGDTEATKTTGLVSRLQAEAANPTADVWWASEPMGTILLDESGILEPGGVEGSVGEDWPQALRSDDWSWVGNAVRARVIGYSTGRVENPPTTMAQLTEPRYKGRVGIARPQFGTTRIHMSILADTWGMENFEAWLEAMVANGVRLYDGNATVVRAIAMGEIDIALTDTDDIWSGQENGWEVDLVYETREDHDRWPSAGPALIPNTVAVVRGAPHPGPAARLAAYLASPTVERLLYESTTNNTPIDPDLRAEYGGDVLDISHLPDYRGAAGMVGEAMDACERVLMSP